MFSIRITPSFSNPLILEWTQEAFAQHILTTNNLLFRQMKPDMYFQLLSRPSGVEGGGYDLSLKCFLDYCGWLKLVSIKLIQISSYVSTVILKEENTKKRTSIIRQFIKVAKECHDLNDMSGVFAIIHGLKRPSSLIWTPAWEVSAYIDSTGFTGKAFGHI